MTEQRDQGNGREQEVERVQREAVAQDEQVEALEVVDGVLRAVDIVVNDKGLALALETLLGDDVDDGAELVEEAVQRFDQGGDLDSLVEIANVYPFSL